MKFNSRHPDLSWLSNFHNCPVVDCNGLDWGTVEAWYQGAKHTDNTEARLSFAGLSGYEAKRKARGIVTGYKWSNNYRLRTMWTGLVLKFRNAELAGLLLATGDEVLVEDAPWERISWWGIGTEDGENRMGELLMLLRCKLRNKEF